MFHEMPLKLYFMKYCERKVSQCILALRTAFLWNTFGGCFCIFSKVIKEPFRKSYDCPNNFFFLTYFGETRLMYKKSNSFVYKFVFICQVF